MNKPATIPAADRVVTASDNAPPDPYDAHAANVDSLYEEVGHWADGQEIETDAQAEAVQRLLGDVKDAITACTAAQDDAIKPLTAQVTEIRERWYPLIADTTKLKGKAVRAKKVLLDALTVWGNKVRARQAAEAEAARKIATEAAAKAVEAAKEAAGDLKASEAAEDLIGQAQAALRTANRAENATVAGMRANWVVAGVTDETALLKHYWATNRQAIVQAALELARQDVRAGRRTIPGLVIENQPKAV